MLSRIVPALCILILFSATTSLRAQDGPAHELTLEVRVDASDVIVRGPVLEVQRFDQDKTRGARVTVKVLEVIKGDAGSTLEFSQLGNSDYLTKWRTVGAEFLWFLRKTTDKNSGLVPMNDAPKNMAIPLTQRSSDLGPNGFPPRAYPTGDLRALKDSAEVLTSVRAAAKYKPTRKGDCSAFVFSYFPGCPVGLPYRMAINPGDGYVQYLQMPADERMEKLCRRLVETPEEIWTLPPGNPEEGWNPPEADKVPLVREQGVQCLQAFRSEENISLLKWVVSTGIARKDKKYDEVGAASKILASWGIPVR